MKKVIIFIMIFSIVNILFAAQNVKKYFEKGTVTDIIKEIKPETDEEKLKLEKKVKLILRIDSGKYKGDKKIFEYQTVKGDKTNLIFEKNMPVIVQIEDVDGILYYNIVSYDRSHNMIVLGIIFATMLIFIGKIQGIKSLLMIVLNGGVFLGVYIPLIMKGFNTFILTTLLCAIISIVTVIMYAGGGKKTRISFVAALISIFVTLTVTFYFGDAMKINGFSNFDINTFYYDFGKCKVKELLLAGILIASLGFILNAVMHITKTIDDMHYNGFNVKNKNYFHYAMKAGREAIFNQINTLVLFYIGSFMFYLILFIVENKDSTKILLINQEFLAEEFLRITLSGIGIMISVPITSFLCEISYDRVKGKNRALRDKV